MLRFLPAPLLGIISILCYLANLLLSATWLLILLIAKIIPVPAWQRLLTRLFFLTPEVWINNNAFIQKMTSGTKFILALPEGLKTDGYYLVIANHQTWADIIVLFSLLNRQIPMLKFFPKKALFWIPLIGQLCWAYGYPFLHRHTRAEIMKHPEWKGRDLAATKKACMRFKVRPGSLMIFPEGTRFTQKKWAKQQSPYRYLLKPKAGGIAYSLECMGELIKSILDVTIVYPKGKASLWQFCCGRIDKIFVDIKLIPVTDALRGEYENDINFRRHFQETLNQYWHNKDLLIQAIYDRKKDFT